MKIKNVNCLIPVGQRVVVKTEVIEEKSDGGIILSDKHRQSEQDKITEGLLVDCGPTAFIDMITDVNQTMPKKGCKVYFVKYAGRAIVIDDQEYRIINDEDIFAFMKEDKDE